jgi:hypothetical protein
MMVTFLQFMTITKVAIDLPTHFEKNPIILKITPIFYAMISQIIVSYGKCEGGNFQGHRKSRTNSAHSISFSFLH